MAGPARNRRWCRSRPTNRAPQYQPATAVGPTWRWLDGCNSRTRRTPPATPARCRAAATVQSVRRLVGISLDPHHRKDDDTRRLGIGIDIAAATERPVAVWKLHDDPHAPLPGHRS